MVKRTYVSYLLPRNRANYLIRTNVMAIGERLRVIRKEQGLTAKDLSEASGVPEKTIYRIETGEVKDPRLSSIKPLIEVLNCSADEFLFDPENFNDLDVLRREFAHATRLEESQLELLLNVVRRLNLAFKLETAVLIPENDEKNPV